MSRGCTSLVSVGTNFRDREIDGSVFLTELFAVLIHASTSTLEGLRIMDPVGHSFGRFFQFVVFDTHTTIIGYEEGKSIEKTLLLILWFAIDLLFTLGAHVDRPLAVIHPQPFRGILCRPIALRTPYNPTQSFNHFTSHRVHLKRFRSRIDWHAGYVDSLRHPL